MENSDSDRGDSQSSHATVKFNPVATANETPAVDVSLASMRDLALSSAQSMVKATPSDRGGSQSTEETSPFPFPVDDLNDSIASAEFASKSLCERFTDVEREVSSMNSLVLPTLVENAVKLEQLFSIIDEWHGAIIPETSRSLKSLEQAVERAEGNAKVAAKARTAAARPPVGPNSVFASLSIPTSTQATPSANKGGNGGVSSGNISSFMSSFNSYFVGESKSPQEALLQLERVSDGIEIFDSAKLLHEEDGD